MTENTTLPLRPDVSVKEEFNRFRQVVRRIYYQKKTFQEEGKESETEEIKIIPGKFTYGGIVDALVTKEYPIDVMQAVQNNYLLDPVTYKSEFDLMQAWRAEAKEIAKAAIEY